MPTLLSRLGNAAPTLLLRSPLHPLVSGQMLELEFTGRRSGRQFRTPLAYASHDGGLVTSTDSPWWRNVQERPEVRVRLRGRWRTATCGVVEDTPAAQAALRALLDAVSWYPRPAGLSREHGRVPDAELVRALAAGRRVLRLEVGS